MQQVQHSYNQLQVNTASMDFLWDSARKIAAFVLFLLTPEDTTETGQIRRNRCRFNQHPGMAGQIKAFFWMFMAILLPLLLAQAG